MADFEDKFKQNEEEDNLTSSQEENNNEGNSAFTDDEGQSYEPGSEVSWTSSRTGIQYTFLVPGARQAIAALGPKFVGDEVEINPMSPEVMQLAENHVAPRPNFDEMNVGDAFELLSAFVSYLF